MKRKIFSILTLCSIVITQCFAYGYTAKKGERCHRDDFKAVMPFVWNQELDAFGKSIMDNLDRFTNNEVEEYGGLSTYQYWKAEFGLSCKIGDHRHFFHWGYQRNPWSDNLLQFLPESVTGNPVRLNAFKAAVRKEQQRRNRMTNAEAERVLGFGSTGVQARYANAFVAILYDVHILGDYETKSIDGLAPVSAIVAELNTSLNNIDRSHASALTNKLRQLANTKVSEREKALAVLQYLRDNLPSFIYNADDGRVNMRKHFEDKGWKFKRELTKK